MVNHKHRTPEEELNLVKERLELLGYDTSKYKMRYVGEKPEKISNSVWSGYSIRDKSHMGLERKRARDNFNILKNILNKPRGKILDIGCSHGFFMKLCEKNGLITNGIDIDPEIIDGKKVKECNVEKDKFPFKDNTFDFVYSANVLQHINCPPIHMMKEIKRVLKPMGKLIIITGNSRAWSFILLSHYDNFRHKKKWTYISLKQLFEFCGFRVIFLQPRFIGKQILTKIPSDWLKFHLATHIVIVGELMEKDHQHKFKLVGMYTPKGIHNPAIGGVYQCKCGKVKTVIDKKLKQDGRKGFQRC